MKQIEMTSELERYVSEHNPIIDAVLNELQEVTAAMPMAQMQVSAEQGVLLHFFAKLLNATEVLEIGCFTGYSAICLARALPLGGRLITIDHNPETSAIAAKFLEKAQLSDRVELRQGVALDILPVLYSEGLTSGFDLIFIDADKENVSAYYEHSLNLVRRGGMIIVDNALWSGRVADQFDLSADTQAIRALNRALMDDHRVERCLLPFADGLQLLIKR